MSSSHIDKASILTKFEKGQKLNIKIFVIVIDLNLLPKMAKHINENVPQIPKNVKKVNFNQSLNC